MWLIGTWEHLSRTRLRLTSPPTLELKESTVTHEYNYSPRPIGDYLIHGLSGRCEAGAISSMEKGQAIWNLFWMSVPTLDRLPGAGPRWAMHYQSVPDVAASIAVDVTLDEVLYRKLLMHPSAFVAWFEREDHTIYDVHALMGGQVWVDRVLERAREAARRMASEVPALRAEGNIVYAIFGKKAA